MTSERGWVYDALDELFVKGRQREKRPKKLRASSPAKDEGWWKKRELDEAANPEADPIAAIRRQEERRTRRGSSSAANMD